nr:retrovirus-related Pol polyprotein from transposon TNT 1-94 [Tanacetum cinerariifolium]
MANLSEDIQCVGFDNRPPMLDRTDFASWQQRIRLYCRGKENGVNILKSIDEGPYQMGTVREPFAEGTEGAPHLGPERPRVYSNLSPKEKDRYNADIRATNILLQGLPKDIYTLINHYTDAKDILDNVKMLLEGSELTKEDWESHMYDDFEHFRQYKRESIHDYYVRFAKLINDMRNIKMTMSRMQLNSKFVNNMLPEWGRFVTAGRQNRGQGMNPQGGGAAGYGGVQNRVGNVNPGQARQAQDNGVALDAEQLLFLAGGHDNAFDDDDAICAHHEEHVIHDSVQLNHVVDSHADYMSDSNMIPYDQYVMDNEVPVVHSNVSSVLNDAFMMTYNDMCEPHAQSVSNPSQNTVVENSLTAELATYKKQVKLYWLQEPLMPHPCKASSACLYNGHEILKDNHVPAIVHKTEDTLEIAEITRKKMNDKMKDPECVTRKVKIAPHDYSKENFLATFTPQIQLTPEQIFWSQDLIKLKSKALKKHTTISRPIKALTAYPPNTPATLVPRVLPTKSQVKIHIFTLIQLFFEFDKTCKKRITSIGLTEEERGFEQTKKCYLKEVIPFFKTLKDNFEGIQTTLTKEIKEMKDVFEELEAELNVAQLTEMHVANTIVEARCLALEAELANLCGKDNVIRQLKKQISRLQETRSDTDRTLKVRTADSQITKLTEQVTNLQAQNDLFRAENDKIKQHYKELYDSIKITCAKHIEQVKPKVLTRGKHAIYVEPIFPRIRNNRDAHLDYLRHLKESVETIRDIVEEAKVVSPLDRSIISACRYTKHSQELLEYAIGTCPQGSQQQDRQLAHIPLTRKKQVTFTKPSDKISPAKGVNKLPVEDQPRTNKSHLRTLNRVDSSSRLKRTVINSNSDSVCKTCNKCLISSNHDMYVVNDLQSVVAPPSIRHNCNVVRKVKQVWKPKQVRQLDSGCSKHMTRDRSRLMNFVKKFIGTVRFKNDHFGAIMGYEDYVIGDSVISRHSCYVRDTDGVELVKGSRGSNLYTILFEDMMKSSPICLLSKASKNKSWLWHRRLNHLNFGTINDLARKDLVRGLPRLKFEKDHLCSACQLGKSKKHTHKPKTENTNLEVLNTLHMELCGPMRVQTINGKKYILVIVDDYSRFTWVKILRSKDETP